MVIVYDLYSILCQTTEVVKSSCKEDLWLSTDEVPGHSDPSTLSQSVLDEGLCYHEILALFCSVCELKIRQLQASSRAQLRIGVERHVPIEATELIRIIRRRLQLFIRLSKKECLPKKMLKCVSWILFS